MFTTINYIFIIGFMVVLIITFLVGRFLGRHGF